MVFFVCEGCNETVKKNQVEKHVAKCRNCYAVSCVDCQNTFYGDDYAAHTSCISEAEKYEKSLFKGPKAKVNPQDAWMDLVTDAITDCSKADASIQSHLKRLGDLTNIPRNQKKFVNFVKNSLRLFNDPLIEKMWKYLESFKPKVESNPIDHSSTSKSMPTTETSSTPKDSSSHTQAKSKGGISEDEENEEDMKKKAKKEKKKEKKRQLEKVEEPVVEEEPEIEPTEDVEDAAARKARKKANKEAKRRRLEEATTD